MQLLTEDGQMTDERTTKAAYPLSCPESFSSAELNIIWHYFLNYNSRFDTATRILAMTARWLLLEFAYLTLDNNDTKKILLLLLIKMTGIININNNDINNNEDIKIYTRKKTVYAKYSRQFLPFTHIWKQ